MCRANSSTGPKWASVFRSANGCAGHCATGRKTCCRESRLREAELLDAKLVRRYWQEHLQGQRNWQYLIWDVLMLEAWRDRWAKS